MKIKALLTLLVLIFISCENAQPNEVKQRTEKERVEYLLAQYGYDPAKLVFDGDAVIIEGDGALSIKDLLLEEEALLKKTRKKQFLKEKHTLWGGKVSSEYIDRVTISIGSDVPSSWRMAALNAITKWNDVNRSKVKMSFTTGSSHIHVSMKHLDGNKVAYAEYPKKTVHFPFKTYRKPGTYVNIDPDYNHFSDSQKLEVMMHEFGHNIGFAHTYRNATEKANYGGGFDGDLISGTPEYDPGSVMNPSVSSHGKTDFNANDIKGITTIYPGPFVSQFNVSLTGTSFAIVNQTVSYSVASSAGVGSQTYKWEVRLGRYWYYKGNQSSVSFVVPTSATPNGINGMHVRCTITDSRGKEGRGTFITTVEGPDSSGIWR